MKSCVHSLRREQGFSLVEIVVSLAVFSIVMLVATGALLAIVEANKKAQSQQIAMNNLNFAVENMTRAIRIGTNYHCGFSGYTVPPTPRDCNGSSGADFFAFRPYCESQPCGVVQVYRLQGGVLERSTDGINYSAVTSPSIVIEQLRFITIGSDVSDGGLQPLVIITIRGRAGGTTRSKVTFNLQSTISQRLLDI